MITAGLWKDRRARLKAVHQPRYPRDCLGELIQIDGSEHWWFEARGPQCTLLVFVDDATSRLMHLQFVESESTFDYFTATRAYLERYGKPVAFYSDKHGVFRVNKKDAVGGDGIPWHNIDPAYFDDNGGVNLCCHGYARELFLNSQCRRDADAARPDRAAW